MRSAQVATIHCSAQTSATRHAEAITGEWKPLDSPPSSFLPHPFFLPHASLFTTSSLPSFLLPPSLHKQYTVTSAYLPLPPLSPSLSSSFFFFYPISLYSFPFSPSTLTFIFSLPPQVCMVISTNMGRPRDFERLILYLKDVNLLKPDKWGTSQLIAFLQQVWHSVM